MILFADFDGTFYFANDEEKTCANFEAIKKWRTRGNEFCITTGRSYRSLIDQFPKIREICDYYIVDSGSIIMSGSGEILQAFYFDPKMVEGIVKFSESFTEKIIPFYYTPDYEGMVRKDNHVTKLRLWSKDIGLLEKIAEQIKVFFPVFTLPQGGFSNRKELDGYKGFIEIVPIEYGKSNAIKVLQQNRKILAKDILAIGDGLNDHCMVRDFNGFAIKGSKLSDADRELKITDSVSLMVEGLLTDLSNDNSVNKSLTK